MKIQFEQLDLLKPWPTFELRHGYHALRVLVRVGTIPIGEVLTRPARKRTVSHRRLRRRIAKRLAYPVVRLLARLGMQAGPELMNCLPPAHPARRFTTCSKRMVPIQVMEDLLLPQGLPSPWRELALAAQPVCDFPLPAMTVALCTRDRPHEVGGCIEHLLKQDYPDFEILVIDNSKDPAPTRAIVERLGVSYVREARAGLSNARNAALAAARHRWVAFTDDDCRPESNWLRELARMIQDSNCRCVTGLVLPAQLENAAEITFEIYGGLGRGYANAVFAPDFLRKSRRAPAHTWRIGAGANMLLDRDLVRGFGGFDVDMGPGPNSVGGCGEDTDVFYQILRAGHTIHYTPRAIVHHYHRSSVAALKKHIYSYAVGHAAYHVRCIFAYGDYRSVFHLAYHLPRWFLRNYKRGLIGQTKYPHVLVPLEIRGTIHGTFAYPAKKIVHFARDAAAGAMQFLRSLVKPALTKSPAMGDEQPSTVADEQQKLMSYGSVTVKKPVRAA